MKEWKAHSSFHSSDGFGTYILTDRTFETGDGSGGDRSAHSYGDGESRGGMFDLIHGIGTGTEDRLTSKE